MTGPGPVKGDDFVAYREADKWGFRDADGRIVIEPAFDAAGSFSEGRARVKMGRLWGFIGTDGAFVIEPRFEQARHFSGGRAKVKQDGKWAMIDVAGYWVENVDARSFVDDRGRFITKEEHDVWEKPTGQDAERERE